MVGHRFCSKGVCLPLRTLNQNLTLRKSEKNLVRRVKHKVPNLVHDDHARIFISLAHFLVNILSNVYDSRARICIP